MRKVHYGSKMNVCEKCVKSFKSAQGLIRHNSRKISCEIPINLTCNLCKKTFKEKRYPDKHLLKKIPCQKISTLEIELEIEKEKTKRAIIESKNNLEKIAAQKDKDLAIEEKKLERKKQVSNVTIINNIANQININLPAENRISATYSNCIKDIVMPFVKRIKTIGYSGFEFVYMSDLDKSEIVTALAKVIFNNEHKPAHQNIVYITEQDLFMVALHKAWVQKQFSYISAIMSEMYKLCFLAIKKHIGVPERICFRSDESYEKAIRLYGYICEMLEINITAEELEKLAKDGLNIDDILSGKKMIRL